VFDGRSAALRPIDAAQMASEILDLANARPDLGESQRSQLYFAGLRRFRELPGGRAGVASRDELYAWIDLVVPPTEGNAGSGTKLPPVIEAIIATDAGQLLLGPEPAVTAAPLAELARRRPDLSPVQRHELLVGACGQLRRPGFGHDIEASPDAIFAWIDVVAPVNKRCEAEDVLRPERLAQAHPDTDHSGPPGSDFSRTGKPGPSPMLTREQVERTGQDLASRGLPDGERSIARQLGVSRDAVRYALGKGQGRRSQS
jgi:hypothetical protein